MHFLSVPTDLKFLVRREGSPSSRHNGVVHLFPSSLGTVWEKPQNCVGIYSTEYFDIEITCPTRKDIPCNGKMRYFAIKEYVFVVITLTHVAIATFSG